MFDVALDGETKKISWSEGNALKSDADPTVRRAAFKGLSEGLRNHGRSFAFAMRNVAGDYVTESRRRGYDDLMESSLNYNHLNRPIIDAMFRALLNSKHIIKEYYDVKAKLMGTERMEGVDFFAPLPFSSKRKISWDEAKQIVIEGFTDFDTEFGATAADMFTNNRVDAKPRDGKRAGAFCSTWRPDNTAFIMMSYNEDMDSLRTLAHEIGHAVHAYQATPNTPITMANMGMSLAETASEFGSLLFNLKFMKEAQTEEEKKGVLFNMVENFMIVFYEVGSRTLFETKIYDAIEADVLLTEEKLDELYKEALDEMYGDAINWTEENLMHWRWKGHYYISGLRYYNYPYVFGEFSVLAMYAKYREDPEGFTEGYKKFLQAGGSRHPHEMFQDLFGFDLASDEFWEGGVKELEQFVQQCKDLIV
jgi:oligoendopeptidase F